VTVRRDGDVIDTRMVPVGTPQTSPFRSRMRPNIVNRSGAAAATS